MHTDRNDMKVEKSVSMRSHTLELPCKRQIVTDTKSRNASHINSDEHPVGSEPAILPFHMS